MLRSLVRGGRLEARRAERALDFLQEIAVLTVPTPPLLPRIWQLRENLSACDAAYVAVAESADCELVTADARLVRAGVARCPVRLLA